VSSAAGKAAEVTVTRGMCGPTVTAADAQTPTPEPGRKEQAGGAAGVETQRQAHTQTPVPGKTTKPGNLAA